MSVIIRLQNLPWSANAGDIRRFFEGLSIPDGGVHIVGGEDGDAFIAFSTDEDARRAMQKNPGILNNVQVRLYLSSKSEMQSVIAAARGAPVPITTPSVSVAPTVDVSNQTSKIHQTREGKPLLSNPSVPTNWDDGSFENVSSPTSDLFTKVAAGLRSLNRLPPTSLTSGQQAAPNITNPLPPNLQDSFSSPMKLGKPDTYGIPPSRAQAGVVKGLDNFSESGLPEKPNFGGFQQERYHDRPAVEHYHDRPAVEENQLIHKKDELYHRSPSFRSLGPAPEIGSLGREQQNVTPIPRSDNLQSWQDENTVTEEFHGDSFKEGMLPPRRRDLDKDVPLGSSASMFNNRQGTPGEFSSSRTPLDQSNTGPGSRGYSSNFQPNNEISEWQGPPQLSGISDSAHQPGIRQDDNFSSDQDNFNIPKVPTEVDFSHPPPGYNLPPPRMLPPIRGPRQPMGSFQGRDSRFDNPTLKNLPFGRGLNPGMRNTAPMPLNIRPSNNPTMPDAPNMFEWNNPTKIKENPSIGLLKTPESQDLPDVSDWNRPKFKDRNSSFIMNESSSFGNVGFNRGNQDSSEPRVIPEQENRDFSQDFKSFERDRSPLPLSNERIFGARELNPSTTRDERLGLQRSRFDSENTRRERTRFDNNFRERNNDNSDGNRSLIEKQSDRSSDRDRHSKYDKNSYNDRRSRRFDRNSDDRKDRDEKRDRDRDRRDRDGRLDRDDKRGRDEKRERDDKKDREDKRDKEKDDRKESFRDTKRDKEKDNRKEPTRDTSSNRPERGKDDDKRENKRDASCTTDREKSRRDTKYSSTRTPESRIPDQESKNVQKKVVDSKKEGTIGETEKQEKEPSKDTTGQPQNKSDVSRKRRRETEMSTSVHITGLPVSVTFRDVRRFFVGCEIPWKGLKLINDKFGNRTGVAFVKFDSVVFVKEAMHRSGRFVNDSPVTVTKCSDDDFEEAIDSFIPSPTPTEPPEPAKRAKSDEINKNNQKEAANPIKDVKQKVISELLAEESKTKLATSMNVCVNNLPPDAEENDLLEFFKPMKVKSVFLNYNRHGNVMDSGYVEFVSGTDMKGVLKFNGRDLKGKKLSVNSINENDAGLNESKSAKSNHSVSKKDSHSNENRLNYHKDDKPQMASTGNELLREPQNIQPQIVRPGELCVRLYGIPFEATMEDILNFCHGLELVPGGTYMFFDEGGRARDVAYIQLTNEKHVEYACKRSGRKIGRRFINLAPLNHASMVREIRKIEPNFKEEPMGMQRQSKIKSIFDIGQPFTDNFHSGRDFEPGILGEPNQLAPRPIEPHKQETNFAPENILRVNPPSDLGVGRPNDYDDSRNFRRGRPIGLEDMPSQLVLPHQEEALGRQQNGTNDRAPINSSRDDSRTMFQHNEDSRIFKGRMNQPDWDERQQSEGPPKLSRPGLLGDGPMAIPARGLLERPPADLGGPNFQNQRQKSPTPEPRQDDWLPVAIKGAPPKVTLEDILEFFLPFTPILDSVKVRYRSDGTPTGDVVVAFPTAPDASRAIRERNMKPLCGKPVHVFKP